METIDLVKPTFKKAGSDDFYHQLHKEVQNDKKFKRQLIIKAFICLALYFGFYS